MVYLALSQITMSSQLNSFTTVFDSVNYKQWAKQMKAFLRSQGLWGYATGTVIEPPYPTKVGKDGKLEKTLAEDEAKWHEVHDPGRRCRTWLKAALCCTSPLPFSRIMLLLTLQRLCGIVWRQPTTLLTSPLSTRTLRRSSPSASTQTNILPCSLTGRLLPLAILAKSLFLLVAGMALFDSVLEGLIALAAIPRKWEHLIPIITTTNVIEEVTFVEVCSTVISQYETETDKGQHKAANPASANKLSTVNWKHRNPCFTQQDHLQWL